MNNCNRARRRRLAGVLFFALFVIFASGCTLSKKDVKLHTKKEMQKIVDKRYGKAEFISMEDVEGDKRKRIFTYRDKKYGFTYQVISYPNPVGMDGSTFFYDGAAIRYEYEEPFLAYFMEQEKDNFAKQGIELSDSLVVSIDFSHNYSSNRVFSVKDKTLASTGDKWEEDMQFAWNRVHAYRAVPETTMNYRIDVYDSEKIEFCGTKNEHEFISAETQRIDYYMDQAMSLGKISDIQYLRTETKRVSEVPGLSEQNFYEQNIRDNDGKVNVYYFSYKGEEYFIVDVWVAQELEEEGIFPIFQYYQNYKHYDVSGH